MNTLKLFCSNPIYYEGLFSLKPKDKEFLLAAADLSLKKYKGVGVYGDRATIVKQVFSNKITWQGFLKIFKLDYLIDNTKQNNIKQLLADTHLMLNTISYIKTITNKKDDLNILLKSVLHDYKSVCIAPRVLIAYDIKTVKKHFTKYDVSKIDPTHFMGVPMIIDDGEWTSVYRPSTYDKKNAIIKMMENSNIQTLPCIKNAIKNKEMFVYYELNLIIEPISSALYFIDKSNIHRVGLILSFLKYDINKTVDVFYMESAVVENNSLSAQLEQIIFESIKNDLKYNLDIKKVNIISFELEDCPRINIQGRSNTCAIWSLFLFFVFVSTPNRKIIFKTLQSMTQYERDKLLIVFICFVAIHQKISNEKLDSHPTLNYSVDYLQKYRNDFYI